MNHQPGLFDLAEVAAVPTPEPKESAAVPLEGVTKWTRSSRGRCADCGTDQAADYEAGRPVMGRERATMRMVTGTDTLNLCGRHARRRGWRGTS